MERKHQYIVGTAASLALLGAVAFMGTLYYKESQYTDELEGQLRELSMKEKRLAIEHSVSTQMEEIANEQKAISDEQREAANEQAHIANEMKIQSDIERGKAVMAQQNAVKSEKLAVEASIQAERQQILAEKRQEQAEYARRVADTLSYQALARSLGFVSTTQWNLGNHELAALLAYASFSFSRRYHCDLYHPSIYEALMTASNSSKTWTIGEGSLMKMGMRVNDPTHFISISTYGEVVSNEAKGQELNSKMLFLDRNYDFRDFVETDDGTLYVISRSGHLLKIGKDGTEISPVTGVKRPFRIFFGNNNHLLLIGENNLGLFNMKTKVIDKTVPFDIRVQTVGRLPNELLLIGKGKKILKLRRSDYQLSAGELPVNGQVSTCTYSRNTETIAYGMDDGRIILVSKNGRQRKLVAHRSRISRLSFDGSLLYSTSYDGTVNVWNTKQEKADFVRVLTTNSWVVSFAKEQSQNSILTGDQDGHLTRTLIDATQMGQHIRESLTRNLTREEWAQYVGEKVPYEKFK